MALTKATLIDLNSNELILDLDADTSITADTDDTIHFKIAGADEIVMTGTALTPAVADGSALGSTTLEWSDLYLADAGNIFFGSDQDVKIVHRADDGLRLQTTKTSDNSPFILSLESGETDIAADDVIGQIDFAAIAEATGTDANLVAAGIAAVSEGDFSASSNATKLSFRTAVSETASEKMSLTSNGDLFLAGGLIDLKNDGNAVSQIKFYCESSNAHAQTLIGAPHSQSATNTLTLPDGNNGVLLSTVSTATVTNKTFTSPKINEDVAVTSTATEINLLDGVTATTAELNFTDGGSTIGTTAVADGDGIIHNDGGTMKVTTAATFKTYFQEGLSSNTPSSADGQALGSASLEWSDLFLADGGQVLFGNDQEITLTHDADVGLKLKHTATADDKPIVLTLQTGETDMAANDVIGAIRFQAPDEGTGTDAILIAAAIQAVAEGDFAADDNATRLEFHTGASEAAASKMTLSSAGLLTVTGGLTMTGTTPTLTIGDAGAEDAKIVFDGNAQDFHIGLDDSADDLIIGKGSALGTTPIISMTDAGDTTITSTTSSASSGNLTVHSTGNANPAYSNIHLTTAGNTTGCFIKGVQASSGNDGRLEFWTNNSGTARERMRIMYDGRFLLSTGDSMPTIAGMTHVETDNNSDILYVRTTAGAFNNNVINLIGDRNTTNETHNLLRAATGGGFKAAIRDSGNLENVNNSYGSSSDQRIKQDIEDASSQWDDIKALKVRKYKLKREVADSEITAQTYLGVVAQELEAAGMNGLVGGSTAEDSQTVALSSDFGTLYEDGDSIPVGKAIGDIKTTDQKVKSVKYSILYMKAIKALQEAQTRIETLETKVKALEDA